MLGAAYAGVARALPGPAPLRGPLAALAEHLATWPGTAALDRVHPAADDLPSLWGSGRAFAQATWRHVVFGIVLGELERRLNAGPRRPRRWMTRSPPRTATGPPSTWSPPAPRRLSRSSAPAMVGGSR